jgi:hypothetical protein
VSVYVEGSRNSDYLGVDLLTLNRIATVPAVAQRAGGWPLSKGMRATRVCSELRTDLYETWHNRQGVLKTRKVLVE